ncbi:MAG TPA: hypothetical protein VFE46_10420 [Pirellulales bacterium]|nr:hypothetical protein [Pirellulales bacterium]
MSHNRPPETLRRFFAGLTEFAFETRMGVADTRLIDYLTDLLVRFVRHDALLSLRNLSGERLDAVAVMLLEADARIGDARRKAHRHIGDFTLFWTGLYPETLRSTRRGQRHDFFHDYCEHGKRAYYIASTIPLGDPDDEADVLQRLSHEFDLCTYGLGEVRREWERRDADSGSGPIVLE